MYNLPIRQKNDSKYALGKEKKAEEVSQGRGGAGPFGGGGYDNTHGLFIWQEGKGGEREAGIYIDVEL